MKERLSLVDFISQVSTELRTGQSKHPDDAFFELTGVTLEVSFTLDTKANGCARFVVVDVGAETSSSKVHRVTLQLDPKKKSVPREVPQGPIHSKLEGPSYRPSGPASGPTYDSPGVGGLINPINPLGNRWD